MTHNYDYFSEIKNYILDNSDFLPSHIENFSYNITNDEEHFVLKVEFEENYIKYLTFYEFYKDLKAKLYVKFLFLYFDREEEKYKKINKTYFEVDNDRDLYNKLDTFIVTNKSYLEEKRKNATPRVEIELLPTILDDF
jgi:hypothetical protein